MAYVFSQNNLSPLLNQGPTNSTGASSSQPKATTKSTFQDPNKLLQKNSMADQGAVNTAVTGAAQKTYQQNNAQLDKEVGSYQKQQEQKQPKAVSDVKGDIKAGGTGLSALLKNQAFQADQFQAQGIKQMQGPNADYSGTLQSKQSNMAGQFYSPGQANLDAALFKSSGAQAKADSQLGQLKQAFEKRLYETPQAVQQQAQAKGTADLQAAQSKARDEIAQYRDTLERAEAEDFFKRYKADQEQAAIRYSELARQQNSGLSTDEIMSELNNGGYYRNMKDYVSNETLPDQTVIAQLLGGPLPTTSGNIDPFIDRPAMDNNINKLIQSRIIKPPENQGNPFPDAPLDKIAEARRNVIYNSQKKGLTTAQKKKNDALIEQDKQFLAKYGVDPFSGETVDI